LPLVFFRIFFPVFYHIFFPIFLPSFLFPHCFDDFLAHFLPICSSILRVVDGSKSLSGLMGEALAILLRIVPWQRFFFGTEVASCSPL